MTADTLNQETIKLAAERRMDPYWSLRSVGAALKLAGMTDPADQVLWPADQGGLAWEVLAGSRTGTIKSKTSGSGKETKTAKAEKSPASSKPRKSMQSGRIVCVGLDDRLHAGHLWRLLESSAAAAGRELCLYRLLTGMSAGSPGSAGSYKASQAVRGDSRSRYPSWLIRILDLIFPQPPLIQAEEVLRAPRPDRDARELVMLPPPEVDRHPVNTLSSGFSDTWVTWLAGHPEVFTIPCNVEIQERFYLARASAAAGFLPLLSLKPGEGAEASAFTQRMILENQRIILRTADDPCAAASFQVNTGISIYTPASDTDLGGALNVVGNPDGHGESFLIIEAGKTVLTERSALKTPWTESGTPVVFETTGGTAGSILIAAPGYHAAEAVKAARLLGREKFSVTVISLRYLRPCRTDEILKAAENFDLVLFSESGAGNSRLFASEVLYLISEGLEAFTISGTPGNARTIADNAISALREQRFKRTLDDVREDRWR